MCSWYSQYKYPQVPKSLKSEILLVPSILDKGYIMCDSDKCSPPSSSHPMFQKTQENRLQFGNAMEARRQSFLVANLEII